MSGRAKTAARGVLIVGGFVGLLLGSPFSSPEPSGDPGVPTAGQTVTLLPDGRWLVLGGQGPEGAVATAEIWNPASQTGSPLATGLQQARAWHTATVLPDGTVLVFGGIGRDGRLVESAERFHPRTETFEALGDIGLAPRAGHTATVLTSGTVLVAGGISASGGATALLELWDPDTHATTAISPTLVTARQRHTATLMPDGSVMLWGGVDETGAALGTGELVDPVQPSVTPLSAPLPAAEPGPVAPQLTGSWPADGARDVSVDTRIALRFSKPLRGDTLTADAVILSGPQGPEPLTIVAAEGGRLVFVTAQDKLQAGTRYNMSLSGAADADGFALEPAAVSFTTAGVGVATATGREPSPRSPAPVPTGSTASKASGPGTAEIDDEAWAPGPGDWRTHRPASPWQSLPPLEAPAGTTALAGQVLRLNGQPLQDVTLKIGEAATRTDDTGRFLLTGVAPGVYALHIDGRSASGPGSAYGLFEANVEVKSGVTSALPYTIWMPRLDTQHAVTVPAYTTTEVVVTTPRIPGLELRIPAHAAVRDEEGNPVTEVTITPIPLDRPPFPLPRGVDVPLYFTVQPGGAYIATRYGTGARLVYPNTRQAEPGTRFEFWDYQAERKGWYIYGLGSVTANSRQVAPAPGVAIYAFSGAMVAPPANAPAQGPPPGGLPPAADPVDLATGLFVYSKTDLSLPDVLPITLTRTYRPQDPQSRPFGRGTTHPYEMLLVGNTNPWTWADVVLPDGGRVHYERISPGTGFTDAEYEHTSTPTVFYKSRIKYNLAITAWELTLKDGTVYVFGDVAPLQAIRDRYGNTLTLTREFGAQSGKILKITSSHGRWIDLAYDTSGRISQARDNAGRTVGYTYDTSGRLWKVTDPAGGVTEYTYDASHRMLTIKDPRGIVFLTNEYDADDRVIRQTLADGATYQFAYTIDSGTGKIAQVDLTDPRGFVRRVTFNPAGYPLTDTRALGTAVAQVTTWTRDPTSNRATSMTDALGRRTDYAYDTMGNVLTVTRLAGTPSAVTTTFTYEPTYNRVASVTNPLNHTTTFSYDSAGNLMSVTNPLGHQTTFSYNAAGQPLTISTPAGTTTLAYDQGDLVSVTDPAGQTTTRFIDNVGRLVATTSPLGPRTHYEYDPLNRMTKITDALGSLTQFTYDPNGSLLSVTDARGNATTYAYNNMDRLQTRTDPLLRAESYGYDNNGNLATFTDRKSQVTSRTYDGLDRLGHVTYADNSTTTYTWDSGDRLTQITDSTSGTITRTYDLLDRLIQESSSQGSVSYTYDAGGRRTSMTVAGQPTVTYGYDNATQLTSITQGSSVVSFAYDASGRRTSLALPNGVITEYAYDAASRLTGLTHSNGAATLGTLAYTYDKAGNRRHVGGTWARTRLPQPVASALYDAANQQLAFGSQTLAYDGNGNLTSDGATTYTWNARDQFSAITGTVPGSFRYDALGRRTSKTIDAVTTEFLYDQLNPVQELSGASTTNLLVGLGIDEYFSRTDVTGARTLLTDALGSTVALTDTAGAVEAEYTYEPFGATSVTGISSSNQFQYTGREDDATGLYYYRARYYDPTRARFISPDPLLCGVTRSLPLRSIKRNPQALNAFIYVTNAPVNQRDPLGLSPECSYYGQRCSEVISPASKAYYCVAARVVCETTPRNPWANCYRQCLQDFDRYVCVPIFGRKDPQGLTAACAEVPGHVVCLAVCPPF